MGGAVPAQEGDGRVVAGGGRAHPHVRHRQEGPAPPPFLRSAMAPPHCFGGFTASCARCCSYFCRHCRLAPLTGPTPLLLCGECFAGPPGTGKTSTALALCQALYGPTLYKSRTLEVTGQRGNRATTTFEARRTSLNAYNRGESPSCCACFGNFNQ